MRIKVITDWFLNRFELVQANEIHPGDVTFIRKTEVTIIPYDEMFMNRYADDLARKNELACNGDVFL